MVGKDSFPHKRIFGEVSTPLNAETSQISNVKPKGQLCANCVNPNISIVRRNFVTFANYQLSCLI